jgi:hypothetical protein
MARQIGKIMIVGTIDDMTFYEMDGQGYARRKSRLRGERVKKAKEFARTMESARRLGRGSQLASKVYRSLPRTEQVYTLFKELKRIAVLAIKEGRSEEQVMKQLQQRVEMYQGVKKTGTVKAQPLVPGKDTPVKKTPRLFRVLGGKVKAVRKQRSKGPGRGQLPQPAYHLGIGQGESSKGNKAQKEVRF